MLRGVAVATPTIGQSSNSMYQNLRIVFMLSSPTRWGDYDTVVFTLSEFSP
jgi:hypothetical protein